MRNKPYSKPKRPLLSSPLSEPNIYGALNPRNKYRCLYCHNPDAWTLTNGIPVTLTRAIEELRKYRHGLKIMSGGFTLSGGETLMQDRFAVKLLGAARNMGIHTALDTNGYMGERLNDKDLETISLVLLDIKGWDAERHRLLDQ